MVWHETKLSRDTHILTNPNTDIVTLFSCRWSQSVLKLSYLEFTCCTAPALLPVFLGYFPLLIVLTLSVLCWNSVVEAIYTSKLKELFLFSNGNIFYSNTKKKIVISFLLILRTVFIFIFFVRLNSITRKAFVQILLVK